MRLEDGFVDGKGDQDNPARRRRQKNRKESLEGREGVIKARRVYGGKDKKKERGVEDGEEG